MPVSRKRKAPKAEPEEDWRSTLFFWRGELSAGAWAGTWVGAPPDSAAAEPTAAQHAASAATFTAALTPPAGPDALQGLACAVASRYQLDQGDGAGLQEYADSEHHLVVAAAAAGAPACAPAAATGANNFGAFVSVGRVVAGGAEGAPAVLTLARRYVREGDARASLRGEQGARAVLEQYARAGGGGEEPAWLEALPLFVPAARRGGAKKGTSE